MTDRDSTSMTNAERLRHLPAVDQILRQHDVALISDAYSRPQLIAWIRMAVDECRREILRGAKLDKKSAMQCVIRGTLHQCQLEDGRRQTSVINATGILLHTNLGRAPLAARAIQRMVQSAGYANVEMDLRSGKRNHRGERIFDLLAQLTGAEDAVVVNNCAAATILVLQVMAAGKEVIVSRGQLVEIGGGFRLPEVFAASGAVLREVGTTNRTYLRDYEHAIGENTGAIIRVHRSNFFQGGFVTEPDIAELISLGKQRGVPVIDDLGSGCIKDLSKFGLKEPAVTDSVAAGADLALFSGDKLFGGPQAGIVVGKAKLVELLRRHPMMRALRTDKMTLAAIEATAEIHLSGNPMQELPLMQMLSKTVADVRTDCKRVLERLPAAVANRIEICECTSSVGGGSVPGSQIASCGLVLNVENNDAVAKSFRTGSPAVVPRIHNDAIMLDLRTVDATQLDALAVRVEECLTPGQ